MFMNKNKLLTFAKSIKDFRLNRKKLHPVENIVFITIFAVICNAQDWEEVEDFGNSRKEFFKVELQEEPQAIIYQKLMWIDIDQIDALHWIEHNRPYLHLFKRIADLEPKTVDIQSMDQLTEHLLDPQLLLGKVNTNEPELNELFSFYGFNDPF